MRILVVGPGRSGTSWVTVTLGSTPGAGFLLEPDNPGQYPFAVRAAVGTGVSPIVAADDPGPPGLRRLWDVAFGAPIRYVPGQQRVAVWLHSKSSHEERARLMRTEDPKVSMRLRLVAALAVPRNLPPGTRHRIVKSIRSQFMVEWIDENWKPAVVVCRRHPLDVVASRMEMQYRARPGLVSQATRDQARLRYGIEIPASDGHAAAYAWGVAVQMSALDDALRANPHFHAVDHEDLCLDPVGRFRNLASALGLDWTADDEAAVEASNRPGTGYELNRVRAGLTHGWRRRLSADDARAAADVIAQFPIAARYDLEVSKSS
jgi:hypothetical protein